MTLQKLISRIFFAMALCFSLVWGTTAVHAQEDHTLVLRLENYQEVVAKLPSPDGHRLQVWKLDDSYSHENRVQIVRDLHTWDEAQLSSFKTALFEMIFGDNEIQVPHVPNGLYYVRSILKTEAVSYPSEFLFEMTDQTVQPLVIVAKKSDTITTAVKLIKVDQDGKPLAGVGFTLVSLAEDGSEKAVPLIGEYRYSASGQAGRVLYTNKKGEISVTNLPLGTYRFKEVEPLAGYEVTKGDTDFKVLGSKLVTVTVVNKKLPRGNAEFMKVDGRTNHSLQGAIFKVMTEDKGQYTPVLQDGKEVVVTSEKNGRFRVEGLEYGDYYLWEIQSPKGYVQLASPVAFTVGKEEAKEVVTVVKNNKRPPLDVPDTGEETLYVLMGLAALLFGSGYYLTKKSNN
ncbi:collagen binding domain-containing protein [Streptococcus hillyeri]|uniref:MSCRAMM family protein n=1 Tax=Streptococcus hillyeri TaxID=2282420 RepID=UPI0034E204AB